MSPRTALAVVALLMCTFAASYADDDDTVRCACNLYIRDRQARVPVLALQADDVVNPEGTCLGSSKCRVACQQIMHAHLVTNDVPKKACATAVPPPKGNWVLVGHSVLEGTNCSPRYLEATEVLYKCKDGALIQSQLL